MSIRQELVEKSIAEFWNVRDDLKDRSFEQLKTIVDSDRLPYAVCAVNITGDLNVGMMIRAASLLGAERFILYGSLKYDRRSTVGAQNYIDLVKVSAKENQHSQEIDYNLFHPTMIKYRYFPVFIETDGMPLETGIVDVLRMIKTCTDPSYNYKPCLVFGNEGIGLPKSLTDNMIKLSIPQRGVLRSLNVSSAASIAMYEMSKFLK
jgi:tRNA G18 (ribose-2'-O)-methylase SpoU